MPLNIHKKWKKLQYSYIEYQPSGAMSMRSMSLTKATYLLQQENKTNIGRLSLAVPHSDLSTTLNIFISGVSSRILML